MYVTAVGVADDVETLHTRTVTVFEADTNASHVNPVPGSAEGEATAAIADVAFVTATVPLVHVPAPSALPPIDAVVPESCVLSAYCAVRFGTGVVLDIANGGVPVATVD